MPHRGEIRLRLRDKRRIGYVPQHLEFDHAAPMRVGDFLTLMLQKRALTLGRSKKTRSRIDEILTLTQGGYLPDAFEHGFMVRGALAALSMLLGLILSSLWTLPTGAAIVLLSAALFYLSLIYRSVIRGRGA
jgi:hypothetical protein